MSNFYIIYTLSCITLKLLVIQFAMMTMSVLPTFQLLNNCLRNLLQDIYEKSLKASRTKLHRLALLYCLLCDIVRQLDKSYGLILVILHLSFLLHLISTFYHMLINMFQTNHFNLILMMQLLWAIYHLSKLLMVIEPCHRTHEQMELTKSLITEMSCNSHILDFAIIAELKLFYRHIMLNQVAYKPMQLFTMNRSLVVAIFGTITTYLVIVLQF